MIKELHIHNYFLINNLSLDFSKGFTLITGETGAGKSMLIGAISLLLGEKVDQKMLFNPEEKCIIEGLFDIRALHLNAFFEENELDYAPETIIRREITPGATRSRAFINDTPVTNLQLKELGSQLVDIHSQHETLNLNNPLTQLQIVDRYGRLEQQTGRLRALFHEIKKEKSELAAQTVLLQEALREQEFRQHALQEFEAVNVKEGELEELEQEFQLVGNADTLKTWLDKIQFVLNEQELSLVRTIDGLESEGRKIPVENERVTAILERLRSASYELSDLAEDARKVSDNLNNDPERLQYIEERIDTINRLIFKYHVHDVAQLSALVEEYRSQVEGIFALQGHIAELEQSIAAKEVVWNEASSALSKERKGLLPEISERMTSFLRILGMPDASFFANHTALETVTEYGFDKITFLFTANKGRQQGEIRTVASGGELSRIMLAIKNMLSDTLLFPTMIFDEIDTGISGAVATKAGEMLKQMSATKQIIAITHLPTIAAFADQHLYVNKENNNEPVMISVRYLNHEERVKELAQMLSGDSNMQEALETAAKLLNVSSGGAK